MRRTLIAVHACVLALAAALFVWAAAPARADVPDQVAEAQEVEGADASVAQPDEGEAPADGSDVTEESGPESDSGAEGSSPAPDDASAAQDADVSDPQGDTPDTEEPGDEESVAEDPQDVPEETTLAVQAESVASSANQKALDAYAAKHAHDLAAGRYRIASSLSSGLSLSVSGASTANGAKVVLWKAQTAANQRWELVAAGGGYLSIRNVCSGKYLDVSGGDDAAADGAKVVQWAERDESARSQRWIVVRTSKGYRIISGVAQQGGVRLALALSGGKASKGVRVVLVREKAGEGAQLWKPSVPDDALDALAKEHKSDVADGLYVIGSGLSYASGKQLMLSVKSASSANKAPVIVAGRSKSAPMTHDAWSIRHTSKGYVIITNCLTGKALQVQGSAAKEKAPLLQYADKKGKWCSQLWIMTKEADGSYRLISALAGDAYLVVQVSGSKAASGTRAILATSAVRKSQDWTLTAAPTRFTSVPALNGKTFLVRSALDLSKALGAYKSYKAAGTRAVIGTATNVSSKRWKLSFDTQGYAHLKNENSGRELGVNDAGTAIEAAGKHRWLVERATDGFYTLTSKTGASAGKVLSVKGAKTADNTNAVTQAASGAACQRWDLDDMTSGLCGVDISGHNTGIKYNLLGDFVVVKATEWNSEKKSYTSYNDYQTQADRALAAGKLIGFYHFATNPTTSKQSMAKQAEGFIKAVSVKDAAGNYKYLGRAVLFLDWENTSYSTVETDKGVSWAKAWLDYVYKKTGVRPLIYMNKNCTNAHDWSSIVKAGYGLWGAQYLNRYYSEDYSSMIRAFVSNPALTDGWGAWGAPIVYQYTSTLLLHGSKIYDANWFYGTKGDWLRMAAAAS